MRKHKKFRNRSSLSAVDLELLADILKERIYASLALLAVLMTIDTAHTSTLHVALAIGGTALSLWAASLISSQMARRMVFGRPDAKQAEREHQRHSPLLASAVLPLLLVGLSGLHVISLGVAVSISIYTILVSLVLWSVGSARSMRASASATIVLSSIVLLLGLGVVALKAVLSH